MNANDYQDHVGVWMRKVFPPEIVSNEQERAMRFLEESLELCQSLGLSADKVAKVAEYVYSRPVGEVGQEIGGVMITLACLCETTKWDMMILGEYELDRINQPEVMEKIKAKQVTKAILGITPDELKPKSC